MAPYVHAPAPPSTEPTNQSSLHMILPKGASSSQIYGLGGTQDLVRTSICEFMHSMTTHDQYVSWQVWCAGA